MEGCQMLLDRITDVTSPLHSSTSSGCRSRGINERNRLLTVAIGIQLVIVTLKFRLEVFLANPRFEDFDVSAGVCGNISLPGTG